MMSLRDTSGDPEKFHIFAETGSDRLVEVWKNTGRGWILVAECDHLVEAERKVADWEAELQTELVSC